ncbi:MULTISPECIES: hypothetical protein [unclassified Mesorhizobium]|uniref:hypothetical protein n=1 Tax=unclassified Mesorhizobium TaxID=325217 RepID=UPI00112E3517|nr:MULTISPECIES: hypothetical protein [unclassified Mesorhizobium]MCA0027371.1 hypothetical protein [Mesorhizobium sp. B263B1A]TPJ98644.1 hypothetical protein FJ489_06870 [Mesorhizobium sp. B2-5-12]TPK28807.1 hypothetical protein FJ562_00260 [Mesorhizobium sp. B2-5-6]
MIASRPPQALTFDDAEIARLRGVELMRGLMIATALVAAWAGLARADDVPEAVIDPIAEASALDRLCDALRSDEQAVIGYFAAHGIDKDTLGRESKRGSPFRDFATMRAAEYEVQFRSLSEDGRCAKGRYFFGAEGTKVPGILVNR